VGAATSRAAAHLATTWRGDVPEAVIRAHVAVADGEGRLIAGAGDPQALTTLRSCVKPLQALPFLRTAADEVRATPEEVAVVCSSHSGEPVHERTVLGLLGRIGLDEGALACGPQLPFDTAAANARIAAGLPPRRLDNNCSGKHAGMLATCVVNGWPVEGYERRDHPMQRAVAAAMGRCLGIDLEVAPSGVDGCGLPTYGVPLAAVARGFAAAQGDPAFRRAQDAMASHPLLVGGHGRFDTELLTVAGSRVTAKSGGAAIWAACLRDGGPGVAVKIESGTDAAVAPVALALLRALGLGWPAEALAQFEEPPLRNWEGLLVGGTRVETGALAAAFDSAGAAS
jgi:L-asparaginase II